MTTVDLPAGVVNARSLKRKSASWREVNLVRWEEGTMVPVGGWERLDYPAFPSKLRAIHRWIDNIGIAHTAFLCEKHCLVDSSGGSLTDITPVGGILGPTESAVGGWGDEIYDDGVFGTPRVAPVRTPSYTPCYTIDNWGQELRVMTSPDGRLLRWDPTASGTKLTAVVGAPTGNRSFVVTPERHIMLFGVGGDQAKFAWSDEEDDTKWAIAIDSKAGSYTIEPRSPIIAHLSFKGGVLAFSAAGVVYVIRHIGLPYVYNYERVAECPAPFSAASIIDTPDGAFWASAEGFWAFNGVSVVPVPCSVWDWTKDRTDPIASKHNASMINVMAKSEAWFFFTSPDATSNDRFVIYNYRNGVWSMGKLCRTCGLSFPNDPNPLMSDGTYVYRHESGHIYGGASEMPWAETFTMNILEGANMMTIMQMLPEVVAAPGTIQFRFAKKNNPSSDAETMSAVKRVRSNGYVDVRETARDFRMRVEMVASNPWTLGPVNFDAKRRGQK